MKMKKKQIVYAVEFACYVFGLEWRIANGLPVHHAWGRV